MVGVVEYCFRWASPFPLLFWKRHLQHHKIRSGLTSLGCMQPQSQWRKRRWTIQMTSYKIASRTMRQDRPEIDRDPCPVCHTFRPKRWPPTWTVRTTTPPRPGSDKRMPFATHSSFWCRCQWLRCAIQKIQRPMLTTQMSIHPVPPRPSHC